MGDHVATPKLTPIEYLRTRAKAAILALTAAAVGILSGFIADPSTSEALAGFLPEQYRFLVPAVLTVIGTIIAERVPNANADEIKAKKQAALAA